MKKLLLLATFAFSVGAYADEGLWNIESAYLRLKAKGLEISARDFYSEDVSSLKDAVCSFADAGTCSFISDKGLLLTNYHLAAKFIKQLSTVTNNYLDNGFCAKSMQQELSCEGLYIKQQIKCIDVTDEIHEAVSKGIPFSKVSRNIIRRLTPNEHGYNGVIKSIFNGYRYRFYLYRIIDDIRLVYAPPYDLAKYGNEESNCMWPRRSADLSLFRAYTKNKDGVSIPFQPSKFLSFSQKGVERGNFVMTVGFPKSAMNDRLSSYVKNAISSDAQRVVLMKIRLRMMKKFMERNDTVRLQLITLYSAISNEMKKKEGFIECVRKYGSINQLEDREKRCANRIGPKQDSLFFSRLNQIGDLYNKAMPYMPAYNYYREGILGIWLLQIAEYVKQSLKEEKKPEEIIPTLKSMYALYNPNVDRLIMYQLINKIRKANSPILPVDIKSKKDVRNITRDLYEFSVFNNEKRLLSILSSSPEILSQDIASKFISKIDSAVGINSIVKLSKLSQKTDSISNIVSQTLAKSGVTEWPNADGTLRVSYGHVVDKHFYTSPDQGLKKLFQRHRITFSRDDYNSKKSINLISDCHTSGGSSGSPVLDYRGNIVGLNFDRNKEGLTSDYIYNKEICRNIIVDSRYILSLLNSDKNSTYLLKEIIITQ